MKNPETNNGSSEAGQNPFPSLQLGCDGNHDGVEAEKLQESTDTTPSASPTELLKAMEVVEKDSAAIADRFSSLFAYLRLSLSQAISSTVDHISCFSDAAGRLQECVLDSPTKGNRYINSCLRLNKEMKGMDSLASQFYLKNVLVLA